VAAFAVIGCTAEPRDSAGTPSDTLAPAASGAETFFRYGLLGVEPSRQALQDSLGAPDSVVARAIQNRHVPTQTDSLVVAYYPGLAFESYRVRANGRELPSFLRVSDNRYIAEDAPVRIGMSADDVRMLMGPPDGTSGDTLSWTCSTCTELGNEHVGVLVGSGGVKSVTIYYSID
jgi:hypothetical protein